MAGLPGRAQAVQLGEKLLPIPVPGRAGQHPGGHPHRSPRPEPRRPHRTLSHDHTPIRAHDGSATGRGMCTRRLDPGRGQPVVAPRGVPRHLGIDVLPTRLHPAQPIQPGLPDPVIVIGSLQRLGSDAPGIRGFRRCNHP